MHLLLSLSVKELGIPKWKMVGFFEQVVHLLQRYLHPQRQLGENNDFLYKGDKLIATHIDSGNQYQFTCPKDGMCY